MTTTKGTSRVLQNPYETVKQQYSEIAAERDRARDKINGLLAGFAFLMFVGLTVVSHFGEDEVDYLTAHNCKFQSKERTGESESHVRTPPTYETIYTYNCDNGKKLVVKWEHESD